MARSFVQRLESATQRLAECDETMAEIIRKVGPCKLRPKRKRFESLVVAIVSQQISVAAARTIRIRLEELLRTPEDIAVSTAEARQPPGGMLAEVVVTKSIDDLRSVGLSERKASYVLDLAQQVNSGQLELLKMGRWSNDRIIDALCKVRGIGRWTAEMFLIFSLGRLDVLPRGDLGVLNAIRDLYGLDHHPDAEFLDSLEDRWGDAASVASWYCWRSLDNEPN